MQMASFSGCKLIGVNAYSKYPEWAARFAEWITNEENQRLRRAWEQARESEAFERKLCAYHTRLIRGVERAACRCRKEPTAENALYLCDVLDGIERPEVDESGRSGQV